MANPNNPYAFVAANYAAGLDYIEGTLTPPAVPTFTDFIDDVYDYLKTAFYDMGDEPDKLEGQQIKIQINKTISGYINANRTTNELQLTDGQTTFATELINGIFDVRNPEDIKQYITDIEDRILASKLTMDQQLPLLFATAIGVAAYDYWSVKAFTPGTWLSYTGGFTPAINKFPTWISASMEAALISMTTLHSVTDNPMAMGLVDTITKFQGSYILYIVGGSVGVGAGKVLYKWTQKSA